MFFLITFIGLFTFFAFAHPFVPYDGDDWFFLSPVRGPYPIWGAWNPIKVLPETFMPLCGYIAANWLFPIVGDYIQSITICAALFFSFIITVYFFLFYRLFENKLKLSFASSLLIIFLLIVFHFTIFQSNQLEYTHIFHSDNLTCYFHYTLPALLNASLVLYLFGYNDFLTEIDFKNRGFLVILFYLAIFSNIYHSIILISFIAVTLSIRYMQEYNNTINLKFICFLTNDNLSWFLVLITWIVSLFFEANGGRANQIGHSIFTLPLKETLICLTGLLRKISIIFVIVLLTVVGIYQVVYRKLQAKDTIDYLCQDIIKKCFLCLVLTLVYVTLVSAKAFPNYAGNTNVAISFIYYLFIIIGVTIAYVIKKYPRAVFVLPCIFFLVIAQLLNTGGRFRESNIKNIHPNKCVLVDKDLISQVVRVDKMGMEEMILVVPKGDDLDNWPHPIYMGNNFSKTLFMHGIITQRIKITVKPDVNENLKYHLNYLK